MELGGTVSKLEDVTASHATIAKMEQLSEDLEADKHQLIELDRKHHQNREMLKQLKDVDDKKGLWVMGGSFFIRKSSGDLKKMLNREQTTLTEEKEKLRQDVKEKVYELSSIEGTVAEVDGFFLQPMDKGEMDVIRPSNL